MITKTVHSISFINTRILLICLFLLLTGLSAGIVFCGILPQSDKSQLTQLLEVYFSDYKAVILSTIFSNSFCMMLIAFSGFSVYGFPFALVILTFQAFTMGFCNFFLLYMTGSNFPDFIPFLGLQGLLALAYVFITAVSFGYAVDRLRSMH